MTYTLLVIDMQPHPNFASTRNLEAVQQAIRLAKRDGNPIVFTELTHWGDTPFPGVHQVLREMVQDYRSKVTFLGKNCSSAATHVQNQTGLRICTDRFLLTGCNTDACLTATAVGTTSPDGTKSSFGLIDYFPDAEIVVIQNACDTISQSSNPFGKLQTCPAVRLVASVEDFERAQAKAV